MSVGDVVATLRAALPNPSFGDSTFTDALAARLCVEREVAEALVARCACPGDVVDDVILRVARLTAQPPPAPEPDLEEVIVEVERVTLYGSRATTDRLGAVRYLRAPAYVRRHLPTEGRTLAEVVTDLARDGHPFRVVVVTRRVSALEWCGGPIDGNAERVTMGEP